MPYGQVYVITNHINNKKYVGQTTKGIEKRFRRHCWVSEHNKNMPIGLAIAKYGKDNFRIEELCTCESQQELDKMEVYYAKLLNTFSPNGYNLKAGAGNGSMSTETKLKIGVANTGKKVSDETRRRLSESHKGMKLSQATKDKLSAINRGGDLITVTNMRQFCIANGLQPSKMCLVGQGKRNHHKGWRLAPTDKFTNTAA